MMFIFTVCMIGKLNKMELRLYLSIGGIFGVIMGFGISLGLASLFGYFYASGNIILPFVLLGK